jgi:hypothetical protein
MRNNLRNYVQRELFLAYDAGEISQTEFEIADEAVSRL